MKKALHPFFIVAQKRTLQMGKKEPQLAKIALWQWMAACNKYNETNAKKKKKKKRSPQIINKILILNS